MKWNSFKLRNYTDMCTFISRPSEHTYNKIFLDDFVIVLENKTSFRREQSTIASLRWGSIARNKKNYWAPIN